MEIECTKCDGYIEKLHETIWDLERIIADLEDEINRRDDALIEHQTWSVEI